MELKEEDVCTFVSGSPSVLKRVLMYNPYLVSVSSSGLKSRTRPIERWSPTHLLLR